MVGGVTMTATDPSGNTPTGAFNQLASALSADTAYPYPDQNKPAGYVQTILGMGTATALQSLQYALQSNTGSIDVITDSGGAQAFASAYGQLSAAQQARIGTVVYLDPAMAGTLPAPPNATVFVVQGSDWKSIVSSLGTTIPQGGNVHTISSPCDHTNQACLLSYAPLNQIKKDGACNSPTSFTAPLLPLIPIVPFPFPPFDFPSITGSGDPFDYANLMFDGNPTSSETTTSVSSSVLAYYF
jgi:hypothetical protein